VYHFTHPLPQASHHLAKAKSLKVLTRDTKTKPHMDLEVILRLDDAQESRSLSSPEFDLRAKLKKLELSALRFLEGEPNMPFTSPI